MAMQATCNSLPLPARRLHTTMHYMQPRRGSSNYYQSNSWDYDSLRLSNGGAPTQKQANPSVFEKLKVSVRDHLISKPNRSSIKLRLIDTVQRLGISYHFEEEINDILTSISKDCHKDNAASMGLRLRLLRENGYVASSVDALTCLKNRGDFQATYQNDVEGLLSLYEASYIAFGEDDILDEARIFCVNSLRDLMPSLSSHMMMDVVHSFELPLHWRAPRLEARWFINHYGRSMSSNPMILEFAKQDFNNVQNIHRQELATLTSWWKDTALAEKLPFARDRLVECFHYANGIVWEPKLSKCREAVAKAAALVVHLDDVYDIYGNLDELVLFTDAIGRWDLNAIEMLPEYMKVIYCNIVNMSNEMADHILREHGCSTHHIFHNAWHDLCNAFLVEAKWHYGNHKPNLNEYLNNGWMSSSAPVLLLHAFPFLDEGITPISLQEVESYPRLVQSASTIFRLCNDSATHSEELQRGDVPSCIAIYMFENGANERESREAMNEHTIRTWKLINEDAFFHRKYSKAFARACLNLARISHCVYQGGDGIGAPDDVNKKQIRELFLEPYLIETKE